MLSICVFNKYTMLYYIALTCTYNHMYICFCFDGCGEQFVTCSQILNTSTSLNHTLPTSPHTTLHRWCTHRHHAYLPIPSPSPPRPVSFAITTTVIHSTTNQVTLLFQLYITNKSTNPSTQLNNERMLVDSLRSSRCANR